MKVVFITVLLRIIAIALLLPLASNAQETSWGEDTWNESDWDNAPESPWQIKGFIEASYGLFSQTNIINSAHSLNELTARIDVSYQHSFFDITAIGDAKYDNVLSKSVWNTRELNVAFSPLNTLDIKAGRQILTWGTGDYLFLNDLFAKDWRSFFSGRDDQYLKAPSNSIKATYYVNNVSLDIAWTPEFTADKYLTGERFSFYSPQALQQVAPAAHFLVKKTKQSQWSTRIATTQKGIEYALYGYRGFWTTPVGTQDYTHTNNIAYFPTLNSWGASIRMPLASGIFNAEYAHYNSTEDRQGTQPLIANSQQRMLLGYESEWLKNLTASLQYYVEKTRNYTNLVQSSATPEQVVSEYRQLLTLRLTYMAMQQKLTYSLFSFYSPSDKDGYLKPSISYRINDHYRFAFGANLFFGKNTYSFFGQHQTNSNIWLRAKFSF